MDGGIKLSKRLEVEREGLRKEFNERDTKKNIKSRGTIKQNNTPKSLNNINRSRCDICS
jgi:hypothetical protein